jgi:hypothetical protein
VCSRPHVSCPSSGAEGVGVPRLVPRGCSLFARARRIRWARASTGRGACACATAAAPQRGGAGRGGTHHQQGEGRPRPPRHNSNPLLCAAVAAPRARHRRLPPTSPRRREDFRFVCWGGLRQPKLGAGAGPDVDFLPRFARRQSLSPGGAAVAAGPGASPRPASWKPCARAADEVSRAVAFGRSAPVACFSFPRVVWGGFVLAWVAPCD